MQSLVFHLLYSSWPALLEMGIQFIFVCLPFLYWIQAAKYKQRINREWFMHVLQAMQQTKAISWPLFHGLENIFCLTEDLQGQVNAFWKKKKKKVWKLLLNHLQNSIAALQILFFKCTFFKWYRITPTCRVETENSGIIYFWKLKTLCSGSKIFINLNW